MRRILLLFFFILCLAGCSKTDYSIIEGTWHLTKVHVSFGELPHSFDKEDLHFTYTFNDNGQFLMNGPEGARVGKWSIKKATLYMTIGKDEYNWHISTLNDRELVIYHSEEEYNPDASLFNDDDFSSLFDGWEEYYRETCYFIRNKTLSL